MDISALKAKVRIAIDEMVGEDVDSDFTQDLDTEIEQALHAGLKRLTTTEYPDLLPSTLLTNEDAKPHKTNDDGSGEIGIPDDFVRLIELRLQSWNQSVWELMAMGSNEAKMQASLWTRGTPDKPKAMMGGPLTVGQDSEKRSIRYWTAGKTAPAEQQEETEGGENTETATPTYDHTVERLVYVKYPGDDDTELMEAMAANHEMELVYFAAGIVMDGKQNNTLAERFYKLSEAVSGRASATE